MHPKYRNAENRGTDPVSPGYASSGVIDSWCLRADGDAAIVFNDDDDRAGWFSVRDQSSQLVNHPPWSLTRGMPYDWRGDNLWLNDLDTFRFAALRNSEAIFHEIDGYQVLQENREWRRSIDRLRRMNGSCLRVEPELAHLLYVAAEDAETRVGTLGWVDQTDIVFPTASLPSRIAAHQQYFFVLQEYETMLVDDTGATLRRFPVPDGFRFVGLDIVPTSDGEEASLVLVSASLDGEDLTRFSVYPRSTWLG